MTWDESKHPRKENGEFTFKNGETSSNTKERAADILYKDEKIKREKDKKEAEYKSKLLDILGNRASKSKKILKLFQQVIILFFKFFLLFI